MDRSLLNYGYLYLQLQIQKAADEIINQHIVQKSVAKISPKMLLSGAVGGKNARNTDRFPEPAPQNQFHPRNRQMPGWEVATCLLYRP